MAGEARKTTARRGRATTRTKKIAAPEPIAAPAIAPSTIETPTTEAPVVAPTPADEPAPTAREAAPAPREWVPIVYEGEGVFADSDAGVFVTGTRTRLRARVADRLLRLDGFRLAG